MAKKNEQPGKQPKWTIMIYMAGDNNLNEDMIRSIYELHTGILTAISHATSPTDVNKVNFLIEFDGNHPNTEPLRYFIGGGTTPSVSGTDDVALKPIGWKRSDDIKTTSQAIANLVKDGMGSDYQAESYALIVSGHSDAFQGRTLLVQENPPGVETIQSLVVELEKVIKPTRKLDLLGFDSCVMNTLEVIYEFKELAKYWLGSQGSIPNYTWDYKDIGKALAGKSNTDKFDTESIIKVFVDQTKQLNSAYSFDGRSVDISGFNLEFFNNNQINESFNKFLSSLAYSLFKPFLEMLINDELDENADETLDFSRYPVLRMLILAHWKCQTFMHDQSIDLRDFCEIIAESCSQTISEMRSYSNSLLDPGVEIIKELEGISTESKNFLAELDKFYSYGATVGVDFRFAKGVSLFFPWSFLGMKMSVNEYTKLKFIKDEKNGFVWLLFIFIFSILTQRPRPTFDRNFIDSKIFSDLITNTSPMSVLYKSDPNEVSSKSSVDIAQMIDRFINGSGGTKDNLPRTRGIDDNYMHYFRRVRNHRSNKKDLMNDRNFGKP